MQQLRIIGLAGTNGSGKDTVGQILADKHSYLFVSVTDLLRAQLKRQNLEVNRENMRNLGNDWRSRFGLAVLVDKAVEAYEAVKENYSGVVIGSLRNPGEADRVHELGGTVVWVDADQRLRYDRIQANAAARGRAGEDTKTFEEFQAEEAYEMSRPAGASDAALDMSAVRDRADIFIQNSGDNLDILSEEVVRTLELN